MIKRIHKQRLKEEAEEQARFYGASEEEPPIVPQETLVKQRQQGLQLISPLKAKVIDLQVKTAEEYEQADAILAQVRQAKANWLSRINPIIDPFRKGLDLLYGLRKDITDPLDSLEAAVKDRMREYKLEEAKRLKALEEARQKELARLEAEARLKEARESKARTAAMQAKLAEQRAKLEQALATAKQQEPPAPIRASGSMTRTIKKWRVEDMAAFLKHVVSKPDLLELVAIDPVQFNAYFRLEQPEAGSKWLPGIEVYEDIDIAARRK